MKKIITIAFIGMLLLCTNIVSAQFCGHTEKDASNQIREASRTCDPTKVGKWQYDDLNVIGETWIDLQSNQTVGNAAVSGNQSVLQNWIKPFLPIGTFQYRIQYPDGSASGGECFSDVVTLTISGALPVRLLSFATTITADAKVQISWQVELDTDADWYHIERSQDGTNFRTIDMVMPLNQSGAVSYAFTDATATKGSTYYYRLKMINKNGAVEYSKTAIVRMTERSNGVSVLPNPVVDQLTIRLNGKQLTPTDVIRILDMSGRVVLQTKPVNGTISTDWINPGTYVLEITSADGTKRTTKLIKQ